MRLGDMLLKARVVSELQLNAALSEQNRWGGKLGQILVRMGALTEDLLVLALCRQLSLPKAEVDALHVVPEVLKQRLDQAACEKYRVLPLAYVSERKAVQLAMSDPFDVVALDDLTRILGTKIEPFLIGDQALGNAIRRLYGATATRSLATSAGALDLVDNGGNTRDPTGSFATVPPQAVSPAAGPASLQARIDEHRRAVRAVLDLLHERLR